MKRVYLVTIFVLFLLLTVIGFSWQGANITSGAVIGDDLLGQEFSSFGLIAIVVMVILGTLLIRNVKKKP
jgi:hypothetical protein